MKKYFTPLFLFFIVLNSFAQNGLITVEKIMELNNGADIFERLIESTLPNIETEKQAEFKTKAETLAQNKKNEAKKYFEKKYNQNDIETIYGELAQEDRVSYSEKTTNFMKEWRSFKAEYQTAFKELYNSYQK
jgi:hypothetical protein